MQPDEATGCQVVIMGDPCYGACDLSLELLAYADVLVHFGHTPLISHPDVLHNAVRALSELIQ